MQAKIFIVDTNIVVAGLLTADHSSPPARILDAMLEGALDILADDARLVDYRLAAYARAQTFSLPFIVNQYEACYFRAASLAAVPSPS